MGFSSRLSFERGEVTFDERLKFCAVLQNFLKKGCLAVVERLLIEPVCSDEFELLRQEAGGVLICRLHYKFHSAHTIRFVSLTD
jgi:hypothetical protein